MSPARNRVLPDGEIVAVSGHGAWMGNRGVLHGADANIVRHHRSRAWITCRLEFRGRRVPQWQPNRYTPLFFLDEYVAYAAGHRPCGECRHADFRAFVEAWPGEESTASEIDRVLHAERLADDRRTKRLHRRPWRSVPVGAFALLDGSPALVQGDDLLPLDVRRYAYDEPVTRPRTGDATLLTPPSILEVLASD